MRRSSAMAAGFLILFALCPSGLGQSRYTEQVFGQLQEMYDAAVDEGFVLRNYMIGALDEGEDDVWTMTFRGDAEYMVYGACDNDCGDIDLTILTEDGDVVDSDTLADDYPVVSVSPSKDTRYQIKATMYECTAEPCYFGIAIFND